MFSQSIISSLQVYGIAIVISMLVAVLIKILVAVTSHIEKRASSAAPAPLSKPAAASTAPLSDAAIPDDVVAVITAAVAALGPHRILHIAESSHAWAFEGRAALHSHQPKH